MVKIECKILVYTENYLEVVNIMETIEAAIEGFYSEGIRRMFFSYDKPKDYTKKGEHVYREHVEVNYITEREDIFEKTMCLFMSFGKRVGYTEESYNFIYQEQKNTFIPPG